MSAVHSATHSTRSETSDDDTAVTTRKVLRPTSEWMTEEVEPTPLRELLRTGQAACATSDLPPEAWFPTNGRPTNAAALVCLTCPVRITCGTVGTEEFGVWGGQMPSRRFVEKFKRAVNAA